MRVAFQGERGAFSEAAAVQMFGASIEPVPCISFDQVFDWVASGRVERGIVPIENSLAGSIHRNYDLLLRHHLYIAGELSLRIVHCLIALPGVSVGDIRQVWSHPQALAQCERFLDDLGISRRIPLEDTAGAVRQLGEERTRDAAAIASRHAAEVYGLNVLLDGIEDHPDNYTRFLGLAREPAERTEGPSKTSIVFSLGDVSAPGSLFRALAVFALRDVNLTKIESRPIPGRLWEYWFYLDFLGHQDDLPCRRALDHLGEMATMLRVLGSYPQRA